MEEYELSIVIPHYNDPEALAACLASLEAQTYDKSRFEVIICDNNSATPVTGLENRDINVSLVVEAKRGAGPARNAGIERAKGTYVAFTDCDCLLEPDFVENGLKHMRQNGLRSVLAGEIVMYPQQDSPNSVEAFDIVYSTNQEIYAAKNEAATGNLWTSLEFFKEVGPFYTGVAEDTNWCHRAFAAGATFHYGGDCIVNHPARATLEELRAKWKRQSAMTFNARRDKPGFSVKWLALCAATAASAIPHSLKALKSQKLPRLSDKIRAIMVLFWCRFFRARVMLAFYFSGLEQIDPNKYWTSA
jgi:glycosyltransferase involved in cell wall biosynthesis